MRTKNFKESVKYFMVYVAHLFEALLILTIYGVASLYNVMNGRFGKRRLKKPYAYVWCFLTWGILVWVVFTYVFVPFFAWWDKVASFLNYVIWG